MKNKLILFIVSCCACSTGSKLLVTVDSTAIEIKKACKAYVMPDVLLENETANEEDAKYIKAALVRAGYPLASTSEEAECVVFYKSISGSGYQTQSRPTFQYIAPKSYNYNMNSYNSGQYTQSHGTIKESGPGQFIRTGTQYYNTVIFKQTLMMSAVDAKDLRRYAEKVQKKQKTLILPVELWRTNATCTAEEFKVQNIVSLLSYASINHIGRNTELSSALYKTKEENYQRFVIDAHNLPTETRNPTSAP